MSDWDNMRTYDEAGAANFTDLMLTFNGALSNVSKNAGASLTESWHDMTLRGGLRLVGWNPEKSDPHAQVAEWYAIDSEFVFTPEESSMIYTCTAENATFQHFSNENLFVTDQRGFSGFRTAA